MLRKVLRWVRERFGNLRPQPIVEHIQDNDRDAPVPPVKDEHVISITIRWP